MGNSWYISRNFFSVYDFDKIKKSSQIPAGDLFNKRVSESEKCVRSNGISSSTVSQPELPKLLIHCHLSTIYNIQKSEKKKEKQEKLFFFCYLKSMNHNDENQSLYQFFAQFLSWFPDIFSPPSFAGIIFSICKKKNQKRQVLRLKKFHHHICLNGICIPS